MRSSSEAPSAGSHGAERVVAVVVTYNRQQLLRECLDGLAAQTRPPQAVVVIDNASTDASGRVAAQHPVVTETIPLQRNVGGAGGFATGIARALQVHGADWVWVMDDDTVPRPRALEALLRAADRARPVPSVLSSRAVWTDGRDHPMNRSRVRVGASPREKTQARALGARPIRTASYVSALLRAEDVRRHGLPHADYFIWSDDFEHTGRLLRRGLGLQVDDSVVEHRTRLFGSAQASPGERFSLDVRNRLWALLRTRSFTWWERVLYGGSTVVGWIRLLRREPDLLPLGGRGLRDALVRRPRPSWQVLAADPEQAALIRAVDEAAGR
ncbi:glycosyltransferase [Brachybacterium sp. EF45031]|uniref:glycosyltransferase n=1 Tax=Brachybacterium sillae TaxID=2810536 RepID=UPI00217E53C3|nr:glycosyltransferase [Brachybacterium sillae]MCS6711033.1 glycosyltransferase [Brachybacterium sillae]